MATLTLFDLFTLQRNDTMVGLIEDVTTYAPEFQTIPTRTRPGTFYEVVSRTAYPTVQFRKVNAGVTPSKSAYKKAVKEMYFLDAGINVDEAVLKGDDKSTGDVWMHEAKGVVQQAFIVIGKQMFYGTSADAAGFAGVRSQIAGAISARPDGSGGAASATTSAYLLWMDEEWGCRFDVGRDGQIALPPPIRQQIQDPNNSAKNLFAWVSNLSCWIGFAVNSNQSVWAAVGIDTTLTSSVYVNALTDQAAGKLISNIPISRRQNLRWFLNRTTAWLLQQSRSTINVAGGYSLQYAGAGGTPAWSPRPDFCEGYPITMTDSITNTESN